MEVPPQRSSDLSKSIRSSSECFRLNARESILVFVVFEHLLHRQCKFQQQSDSLMNVVSAQKHITCCQQWRSQVFDFGSFAFQARKAIGIGSEHIDGQLVVPAGRAVGLT